MALNAIAGKPGTLTGFSATPIDVFYDSRANAKFIPGPVTIDGTKTADAANTPYTWLIRGGTLLGKDTSSGKYENSIIGKTTAAYSSGATALTVSVATAAEIVRRVGASGTLKLVGPPSAAGTVAVSAVTYSAVDTATGILTVSDISVNKVTDSLVCAADGSHLPLSIVCDQWGLKVIGAMNTTRVDVYDAELWAGGGIVNESLLQNWPADTSTQAWIKASIRTAIPQAQFRNDLINS